MIEMGSSTEEMSHTEFAEKLKQQPESVGYLVIRSSKNSSPGAWRRIARRDEHILSKDYGVEAARLKSIDGGPIDSEYAEVELWILPESAPPPAGRTQEPEKKPGAAFKLNTYEAYGSADGEDEAERWVLENFAEMLRADQRATGYIIVREQAETEAVDGEEPATPSEESVVGAGETPQVDGAEAYREGDEAEETPTEISSKEQAEGWKKILSEKYDIAAQRIIVLEGRRLLGGSGRLTTWVVPEKAQPPDPLARDKDEIEEETQEESAAAQESANITAPSDLFIS
jgi:hypothetical protein